MRTHDWARAGYEGLTVDQAEAYREAAWEGREDGENGIPPRESYHERYQLSLPGATDGERLFGRLVAHAYMVGYRRGRSRPPGA